MAEEKVEPRETSWRQMLPWTELFRGFQVALDVNKLILAAVGILVMAFGWWLLAVLFTAGMSNAQPQPPHDSIANNPSDKAADDWSRFKRDRDHWNLMHETAGVGAPGVRVDVYDRIENADQARIYESAVAKYNATANEAARPDLVQLLAQEWTFGNRKAQMPPEKARELADLTPTNQGGAGKLGDVQLYATMATWPWFEDRGPNQFLMVAGREGKPWATGHFWDWLWLQEVPTLLEPINKLLTPVVKLFTPGADSWARFYFVLVLLWTVLTWSIFGGAITRIAAVQVARGEKISAVEALNFTRKRLWSYVAAPLIPVAIMAVLVIGMVLYGYPLMIPYFGDIIVGGLLWPLMIVVGLLLAITIVGLVGWPFMSVTISAQGGTDVWDAFTRAYSYVYQKPWHFIWYSLVALAYGGIVIFFVGFMGSMTVYLAKWGVAQTPFVSTARPESLFVYAPTSYQWRGLLLKGAAVDGQPVVDANDQIDQENYNKWVGSNTSYHGSDQLNWANLIGSFLVAVWIYIAFLLLIGFSYSYFWSASTIVYLLMRRKVDGEDMDEVTLEDEAEGAYTGSPLTAPAAAPPPGKAGATPLTMVDAPSLRPPAPPPAPPPPAPAPVTAPATAPAAAVVAEPPPAPVPAGPPATPPAVDGGAPPPESQG